MTNPSSFFRSRLIAIPSSTMMMMTIVLFFILQVGVNSQGAVFSGENMTADGLLQTVVIGNGASNNATGVSSIAMGKNSNARHKNSFVINLLDKKNAVSKKDHEFRVQTKIFTIWINNMEVSINTKNIGNFKRMLRNNPKRERELRNNNDLEVQQTLEAHNKEIKEQRELNQQQRNEIEQLHKSMEELYKQNEELNRMMHDFIAAQQLQNKDEDS
mmetsp:Transcript_14437/g.16264  ORF Transcript_14437/g.16264 Transcript_14437/m.16264 type:complete len:215 (-) Transcript_14437:171-815(-)|eukprot:CAMPEP_0170854082 /NCGR_PEP_ID=MMETSP0734-20130129/12957_1 /TAXON_ID=186038 /ORGANISM="Fragilariopsis kerguelensis, Strain L26-C5" /LENGTH=214 /DNA_ID=CAMNT_0011225005 /DNA_START=214 /DNA_END=858 /DNA_ORIENTATION=+